MTVTKHILFLMLLSVIIMITLSFFILLDTPSNRFAKKIELYQFTNYQKNKLSILDKENSNWESQNINDYHLQIQVVAHVYGDTPPAIETSPLCIISIDVQNKTLASIVENTCESGGYILPVTGLNPMVGFNLIPDLTTPPGIDSLFISIRSALAKRWCGPNGCECDGYYAYSAEFDTDLGYPKSLKVIYMKHKSSSIVCTMMARAPIIFPDYEFSISHSP